MTIGQWIKQQLTSVWTISNGVTVFFLFIIFILWSFVNNRYAGSVNQVSSSSQLKQKLANFKKNYLPADIAKEYMAIPTGIFIQSFEFTKSNTVQVSGYVWQKIDKKLLGRGITPGVVFPEANSLANMTEAYRYDFGSYTLVGWHFFGVSLLQNFDYSSYPFDIQSIWVRMWPADFTHSIILVPDLQSYLTTEPGMVFGLESDIVKQGFSIRETYFDMPIMHYDTTFGEPKRLMEQYSLELYFNIIIKRKLINAFLIHLLPILVIWSILFAITMIISNDKQFAERVGLSTTQLFTALGGTIFSVILMNNNLRNSYLDQPFLFMEYFYLITYAIIMLVSYDAYVITTRKKVHTVLHHNLLPKTVFWPLVLGSIIFITLLEFFIFPDDVFTWHR
jgi:hypothetical protein